MYLLVSAIACSGCLEVRFGFEQASWYSKSCLACKICPYRLIFSQQVEEKIYTTDFLEKIIVLNRIREAVKKKH